MHPTIRPHALLLTLFVGGLVAACNDDAEPVSEQRVALEIAPTSQAFGDVPLGLALERRLIVRNLGNATWTPAGAPLVDGAAFRHASGCTAPVGPGTICDLVVAFAPTAVADFSGTVTIADTDPNGVVTTVSASLDGSGVPPTVLVSPPNLDFGLVLVGEQRAQTITIENTGTDEVSADVVVLHDAGAGVGVGPASAERTPIRVPAGATTGLGVTWAPPVGGTTTARVVVELCGAGCGPVVDVTGTATAPRIEATPRAVDFGSVDIGSVARERVRLTNAGDGALDVRAIELAIDDEDVTIEVTSALPVVLRGDDGVDVDIVYDAGQGRAALTNLLIVASSDPLSPEVVIPIDGNTTGAGLRLLPVTGHFGRLDDGASRPLSMVLTAIGDAPVVIDDIRVDGVGITLERVPLPATLAAGTSLTFAATATATAAAIAAGGTTATVTVTAHDEAAAPLTAEAALAFLAGGSGCIPIVNNPHVNLGLVQLRTGGRGQVVIDNVGDDDCVLTGFTPGGGGFRFDTDFTASSGTADLIAPGDSGVVDFGFTAERAGGFAAMVELVYDGVAAPLFVSATASGVDGGVAVAPATLTFGPVPERCTAEPRTVVIANTGAIPMEITGVTMTPSNAPFGLATVIATPFRLFPGATTPITVTPRRAAAGVSSATVVVDTALGLTATLALSLDVTAVSTIEERFTAGDAISAVDILFVIDNSGSMSDDQQLLAENFAAFFAEALGSGGVDFQVGVTTTDILTPSAANGALVGAPAILRNTTPDLEGAFGRNVLVGVDGAGLELGLEAMRRAIDHPANSGFIRNNAALSVVFVTDEEDGGAFVADEGLPSLARAPDEYVALLRSTKAGALSNAPVLVSGVITPGQALRYQAVVDAFHGSVLDITRADWGSRLGEIGVDTFALARTFDLQTRTTRASITVTIDGVATTAFSYDTARGAVILDENPPTGAAIVISYQAGC